MHIPTLLAVNNTGGAREEYLWRNVVPGMRDTTKGQGSASTRSGNHVTRRTALLYQVCTYRIFHSWSFLMNVFFALEGSKHFTIIS